MYSVQHRCYATAPRGGEHLARAGTWAPRTPAGTPQNREMHNKQLALGA